MCLDGHTYKLPTRYSVGEKAVVSEDTSAEGGAPEADDDVLANFDENFEEFTPAEE